MRILVKMVDYIVTGPQFPDDKLDFISPKQYEEYSALFRKHMVPFDIMASTITDPPSPAIVVDDKLIPTVDVRTGGEDAEPMDWSFQCIVLAGHCLLNYDLKADEHNINSHFSCNLCPVDFISKKELHNGVISLRNQILKNGLVNLITVGRQFSEAIHGHNFDWIFDNLVKKKFEPKMFFMDRISLYPIVILYDFIGSKWIQTGIHSIKDMDELFKQYVGITKARNFQDPTILCPSCERIYNELK
jgi:hypothetical protein